MEQTEDEPDDEYPEAFNFDDDGTYGSEIVCMASVPAFSDIQKLLYHPNIWISNTVEWIHMTLFRKGLTDVKKVKQQISM
mmetsp:Transcript_42913/g.62869  ORF Transcript_42913/g.62869 Transcript_42913/m.62869 type:complete len:80 (+) Transcript_42913:1452-1691(+)